MTRLRGLFLLASATLTAAATLVAASRSAEACSQTCVPQPVSFRDKLLPPKVLALPLPYSAGTTPVLTLNGVVVPGTVRQPSDGPSLFVPNAPLTDGAYSIAYRDQCAGTDVATRFDVGAAVPDAEKTGTISVTTRFIRGVQESGPTAPTGAKCGGEDRPSPLPYDHMIADIVFRPADELNAYLPIMRFAQTIDGSRGPVTSSFDVSRDTLKGVSVSQVVANCEAASTAWYLPGVYSVTIAGELLGSDQRLPATTASIDLTCPTDVGLGGEDPAVIDSTSSTGSSGCSIEPSHASSTPGTFAALGLGLIGMGLASRRRRSSH